MPDEKETPETKPAEPEIVDYPAHAKEEIKKNNEVLTQIVGPTKTQELGRSVLLAADARLKQEQKNEVIRDVAKILADRQKAIDWRDVNQLAVDFCDEQLKAIEAGQFRISRGIVVFTDSKLQRTMQQYIQESAEAQVMGRNES